MPTKSLNIASIRIDGGTQSRVAISQATVAEYAQVIADGDVLPAITVFFDGADYWLADGFHRLHAHTAAGKVSIMADVLSGICRDAILYSLAANTVHGLRPTNEDKRKAVAIMLADSEWSLLSSREIAKHCGCSHTHVDRMRSPKAAPETATKKSDDSKASGTCATSKPEKGTAPGTCATPATTAQAEKKAAAEQNAQDAYGDADPVALLEEAEKKILVLEKAMAAAEADDQKAETLKWKRIADVANRRQDELMETVNQREKELQRMANWLNRISRAVGEDDRSKLAAKVEALVRAQKA